MYGIRPDIFPEIQTCCEQRDSLSIAIQEVSQAPKEGIITSSPTGDILVGGVVGAAAVIILRGILGK